MNAGILDSTHPIIQPRRLVRWIYLARLAMSTAVYLAAVLAWGDAEPAATLVASLLAMATMVFTVGSAFHSEVQRKPFSEPFLALQSAFDLVLVTAVVHVTGAGTSQFAALYILVIASSALLLSTRAALVMGAFGCTLYFGEVLLLAESTYDLVLWLQLVVFVAVALSSGWIAARLRDARAGTQELAAELVKVRLQASDILRNISSGIITIDARGTLLFANPKASALLALPLESHVGKPILDRIAPVAPVLARALERAASDGIRTTRAEGSVQHEGRAFPIGLNTTITVGDGAESGRTAGTATVIFQDLTDQKRIDTLHLRAERLEAVAELSASLAHEIKNPLASIRSAVEQLGRSTRATPDEQSLSSLIVRESDRLSRLLSEFLDFARVRVTRIEPADLRAIAEGAASLAAAHPDRPEGVEVLCTAPDESYVIEGDEDVLHRAIFNLCLNAVQASLPNGRVHVELMAIASDDAPVGISFDRGGVALRVSDLGAGIAPENRERLFDPFFTTKPGGSGLGLSVVHRAIEAHHGFVLVDSDGRGTRVTVLLPSFQADTGVPS